MHIVMALIALGLLVAAPMTGHASFVLLAFVFSTAGVVLAWRKGSADE